MTRTIILLSVTFLWTSDLWSQANAEGPPKVFQVEASAKTAYSSIQAAIDAAPAGSIVRIGPGTFHGAVQIKKPLTLEGAGADRTILSANWISLRELILEGKGVPDKDKEAFNKLQKIAIEKEKGEGPVTMQLIHAYGPEPTLAVKETNEVVIRGVSISMPGEVQNGGWQSSPMAFLENAGTTIENCAFVGSAVEGVEIKGVSNVTMHECLIGGIRASGVIVKAASRSKVTISDCDLRGCGYAGVQIEGAGDVTVSRCRISKVDFHGIRYDNASPKITGNVFTDINRAGIYIDGKTQGKISENLFFDCGVAGGTEDEIFNNTFIRKNGPSAAWHDFSAMGNSVTSKGSLHHNIISGYNHALILFSTGQKPLKFENLKFESNFCHTAKSAIIHSHRAEQNKSKTPGSTPETVDVPLPKGNWQLQVQFTDPEHGNYSLSPQIEWLDRNCGATKHASLKSPWPEQDAERAMLKQIKVVESQDR